MRTVTRIGIFVALALLSVPVASARMVVSPVEVEVSAGESTEFDVFLQNVASQRIQFAIELEGDGLWASLWRDRFDLAPGESVRVNGTIRAPPWSSGVHEVGVKLVEEGEHIETQTVRVTVRSLWGLPGPVVVTLLGIGTFGVGLVGFGAVAWWRKWHHVFWALYARIERDRLAQHPKRALILDLVARNPGIRLADAQQQSGLANGPFEHHVKKLADANLVAIVERGRSRYLRLPDARDIALPSDTAEQVVRIVNERGGAKAAEVARALGVSRQSLHYHIRQLSERGRVGVRLQSGRLVLEPAAPLEPLGPR